MSAFVEKLGAAALEILYPSHVACSLCGGEARTDERGLCEDCAKTMRIYGAGEALPHVDAFFAGLYYDDVTKNAMHGFKYSGNTYLAPFWAQFIELPGEWEADVIVPVPLHPLKLFIRGYNQSALIANELSAKAGIPVDETLLRRTRFTKSQARLSGAAREQNLKGAFAASENVRGKRIILVDDVRTTGNTLCECARTLREKGAAAVFAVAACAREAE